MRIQTTPNNSNPQKKITLFGDSIPKGLYLEGNKIMRIKRCAVNTVEETLQIKIDSRSAFGQTLGKCCKKEMFSDFFKSADPSADILAVSLGGNDCDYDWAEVAKDPFGYHLPKTPLPLFEELLEHLIETAARTGVATVFTSLPPIDSERYFRNVICAHADGEEVMKFFCGDVTNIARHQESYNAAVMKSALSAGAAFIDFRTEFLMKPDFLDYLSEDGIHPNQKGHDLIADCVIRFAGARIQALQQLA